MVETQFMIWSEMCLLLVSFSLTYLWVMRGNLSWDFIPTRLYDYIVTRALFISYIGLSEVIFALMINLEVAFNVHFFVAKNPTEKQNGLLAFRMASRHCISYAIFVCIFLSICRCLVQRYALGRLSKSDIISMTRVYLVPSTFIVIVVSACSWFRQCQDVELLSNIEYEWTGGRSRRAVFYLYFLVGLLFISVRDFMEFRSERAKLASRCFNACTRLQASLHQNDSPPNRTSLNPQKTSAPFSVETMSHTNSVYNENNEEPRLALAITSNNPISSYSDPGDEMKSSVTSPGMQLQERSSLLFRSTSSSNKTSLCAIFCEFLHFFARLYVSIAIYFALLFGVYESMEFLFPCAAVDDFKAALFTAILVMNGFLRFIQVATSQCDFNNANHRQISIKDLSVV